MQNNVVVWLFVFCMALELSLHNFIFIRVPSAHWNGLVRPNGTLRTHHFCIYVDRTELDLERTNLGSVVLFCADGVVL
jgi:hypothetical protein